MIVVVDDEPEPLRIVTGLLAAEGLPVRPVDSGGVALASIAAQRPDLILLDTRMPGMDGFEVCRRIKEKDETRDIPVVMLGVESDAEERAEGLRLGAADFISKPVQREELLNRVRTHLELSRLRRHMKKQIAEETASLRSANEVLKFQLAERERDLTRLLARQHDLRELADRVSMNIWATEDEHRILGDDKALLTPPGRIVWQLTNSQWTINLHPDDVQDVEREYALAVVERRSFRIECRVLNPAGGIRWVLHTGIPRFSGGEFAGHIGATIDITDLKHNHERMIVSEKFECLGHLAAGLAHDFNNLVGSIFAASDLALSDLPDDSPARANIERINAVASRASEIVSLLLTYAGEYGARTERLDLSLVVAEMAELLRGTVSPKIALCLNLASGLPEIRASVTQIRQVILNLIMNAFEAFPWEEGAVTVSTDRVRIHATEHGEPITTEDGQPAYEIPQGEYCRLVVADTGCGMTAEVRAKAFDPFYSTKFIGRGLGLSVVQGIVRTLGGAIRITTAPGNGATFEVLLPCSGHQMPASGRLQTVAACRS